MEKPNLISRDWRLSVIQCTPSMLPELLLAQNKSESAFFSLTQTQNEVSMVLESAVLDVLLSSTIDGSANDGGILNRSDDWGCIEVAGPLDFSLTGILANISRTLESADVSIFAISTYNTDFVLVKNVDMDNSFQALEGAGYAFIS